jgi:hypothetical protein
MDERESVEEKLVGHVRDGIDAAVFLARSTIVEAEEGGDDAMRELAAAVEKAAHALDEAMIALLGIDDEEECEEN